MATNELQAVITADISGLESGLKKAQKLQTDYAKSIANTQKDIADNIAISKQYEKAIEQLNQELKDGTISQKDFQKQLQRIQRDEKETQVETANLRKELTRLKRDQKDLAATSTTASKGMATMGKSTANATPTLIEFSRVIQDAPYGVQGVANNIQQLTTNFGYLQKSAGGTLPALKALAGSFLGPAGIVFAVSAVTSLLVQYGSEIFSAIGSTNKLTEATKELTSEARAEGVQLNVLLGIAQDESESKEVRQKAIDEINKTYKDYLGNLDLENIKTANVTANVKKLTLALIQRAKIEGLKNAIAEKTSDFEEDILNTELKRTEAYKNLNKEVNDAIKSNAFLNQVLGNVKDEKEKIKQFIELSNKYQDVRNSSRTAVQAVLEYNNAIKASKGVTDELDDSLSNLVSVQTRLQKQLFKNESDIIPQIDPADLIKKDGKTPVIQVRGELTSLEVSLDTKGIDDLSVEGIEMPELKIPKVDNSGYIESLLEAQAAAQTFQEVTTPVFSAVASEIGKTFQTNSEIVNAAINSIISAGAKMLQELIVQSIAASGIKTATATKDIAVNQAVSTSNAVTAASSTAAASGPAAAFLLPALIGAAIGFIAASFAGIKFAHGGIVPGGSFTGDKIPAMLNSGEMVLNAGQQKNLFDILNNNLSSLQSRSSGDSNLVATTVLRGSDLYLTIEREKRKR